MDETIVFFTLCMLFLFYKHLLQFFEKEQPFEEQIVEQIEKINEPKYEEKFLNHIRKMEKEYIFTNEEMELLQQKEDEFLKTSLQTLHARKEEIQAKMNEIINSLDKEEYTLEEDLDEEDLDEEELDAEYCLYKGTREDMLFTEKKLNNELEHIIYILDNVNEQEKRVLEAKEKARDFIIQKRVEKIENCYVMETTPQGNVLMIYDNKRESFKYFSDSTIPYRYLEVVARKYVKQFDCRPLFVDMEEELKQADIQFEKEWKEKEEKKEQDEKQEKKGKEKKSVFAKFKSYNKDTGRASKNIPPKNSIPITKEQENKKILLKERANRYTYEGKLANFSFLKKVDKKIVNKKYAVTFADFKKLQNK